MRWRFDPCDRLVDLVGMCDRTMHYLRRDRCDRLDDPQAVAVIDLRLAILKGRQARFQTEARRARRAMAE